MSTWALCAPYPAAGMRLDLPLYVTELNDSCEAAVFGRNELSCSHGQRMAWQTQKG